MTAPSPIAHRPIGIMPGGCFPTFPTKPGGPHLPGGPAMPPGGCVPPNPTEPAPLPLGRNCWVPRDRDGNPIQIPAPDATIQATEAATQLA